jgi:oxygen-independent coproporphyrinogen-3 oxidase
LTAPESACRHLYVHVPFCRRRCSYCDFSIAVRKDVPAEEFSTLVARELAIRPDAGTITQLDSLYFGGGTPSHLGPAGVAFLIRILKDSGATLSSGAEVTLEANPEDIDPEAVTAWLEAGVNRLSIGIQSFHAGVLDWMHRGHSAEAAADAFRIARAAGFANLSIDLIFGLPERLGRSWEADLSRAIDLAPDHVSLYSLTVEPRTPLGRWTARGDEAAPSDDRQADEFMVAHETLQGAGWEHYEVSNYARPGFRSRHNSSYWRRVPYIGVGPSAHSFDGRARRWNTEAFAAWAAQVRAGTDPRGGGEVVSDDQRRAEHAYLGLRTDAGAALAGGDLDRARSWERMGWATIDAGLVRLTAAGWLRLDALAAQLGGT